jgi:Xaa-Pro aminopeptidase
LKNRIKALKDSCSKKELDGYIVAKDSNMLYFTGIIGTAGLWIPLEGENILYVYGVNFEAVKAKAEDYKVELIKRNENPFKKITEHIKSRKIKLIGFDELDALHYIRMRKELKETHLKPLSRLVEELRMVKDSTEIKAIKKAAELTDEGIKTAVNAIKPGVREYEVAAEIEYAMRKMGSEGAAFDTQVASGRRSAFPHGGCTTRKIRKNELIVVDLGAKYNNYRADASRTYLIGKSSPKQRKIFEAVLNAQLKAFKKIRAGVKACEVDAAARKLIENSGFGKYFVHGLGHGVGLDIHEPPSLNPEGKRPLKGKNVVTIEPGIYIVGYGGSRIEDTVLVHENNAEILIKANRDLLLD